MKSLPAIFICLLLFGLCLYEKKAKERDLQQLNISEKPSSEENKYLDNHSHLSEVKDSLALVPEVGKIRYPLASEILLFKN